MKTDYTHKHLVLATRAHYNTSFSPEKRGEQVCRDFDSMNDELKGLGASDKSLEKLERLFVERLNSKSNCISSMITGPSNFPVARAEKANAREHAKYMAYSEYYEKIKKILKKEAYYEKHPEARPISNDDENALDRLKTKLAKCVEAQETMKEANKLIRAKKLESLKLLLGEERTAKILKPDYMGRVGFAGFCLSNNNAEIRRIQGRIAELETIKGQETEVVEVDAETRVICDPEQCRIYIEFPGKPDESIRNLVKKHGFKWTPSKGHWGRKLTANARYATQKLIQQLKTA